MAKAKRGLIFLTCLTSGLSAVVCLLAFGTDNWIEATGTYTGQPDLMQTISYGLFKGAFKKNLGSVIVHEIVMTCLVSDNVCAMLCKSDAESRTEELMKLYNNEMVDFDVNCPQVLRRNYRPMPMPTTRNDPEYNHRVFISAASYIFTAFFLMIAGIVGLVAAVLAVWNTAGNPVYTAFSILGMQIYNIVAAVCILLAIIVWGAEYSMTLEANACILSTIVREMSTDKSSLGYSYWILFVPLILYPTSAGILYLRQYLIDRDPEKKVEIEDNSTDIILY